jgi:hypothetical protein
MEKVREDRSEREFAGKIKKEENLVPREAVMEVNGETNASEARLKEGSLAVHEEYPELTSLGISMLA